MNILNSRAGVTRNWLTPFIFVALAFSFLIMACANTDEPMRLPVDGTPLTINDGEQVISTFDIEVAATTQQRSAGLMHRIDLPKDRGMLFVFEDESERFFWMQNTPTPLDIIYANSAGRIVYVAKDTTPYSTDAIPSRFPAKYALEIHAGLSETIGIDVGQILNHPLIEKN